MNASPQPKRPTQFQRLVLLLVFIVALAAVAAAIGSHWSFFRDEHERLRPWQAILIWTGNAAALLWFIQFFTCHAILGLPFRSRPAGSTALWNVALVSTLCSLAIDLGATCLCIYDEWQGFKRSIPATARVTEVEKSGWLHWGEEVAGWTARYQFADDQGRIHHGVLRMRKGYRIPIEPGIPEELIAKVQAVATPFELPIRYDPQWPKRSWPKGVDWRGDGDDLHGISLAMLLAQSVVSVFFLLIVWVGQREGRDLWWYETYKAIPFFVEAGAWSFFGLLDTIFTRF